MLHKSFTLRGLVSSKDLFSRNIFLEQKKVWLLLILCFFWIFLMQINGENISLWLLWTGRLNNKHQLSCLPPGWFLQNLNVFKNYMILTLFKFFFFVKIFSKGNCEYKQLLFLAQIFGDDLFPVCWQITLLKYWTNRFKFFYLKKIFQIEYLHFYFFRNFFLFLVYW